MKVLGIISSPDDPASRARIIQYKPYLSGNGVILDYTYFKPLKESDPAPWTYKLKKISGISEWRVSDLLKSAGRLPLLFSQKGVDLIWQNRLIQIKHSFWEKRLTRPVIFDFDDAIWLNEGEKQVKDKIERSALVFAGNEYLAAYAKKYNPQVKVVPTVVDTDLLYPLGTQTGKFIIGWIGTKSNFRYLESIMYPLKEFLRKEPDAQLMIVSSEMPGFIPAGDNQFVFRKWSASSENELINGFTIGIMPLEDSVWTRGKCSYKFLQYLACGKPVIASPVGTNEKILKTATTGIAAVSHEQWLKALRELKHDPVMASMFGENGLRLVRKEYSCAAWVNPIISYMKSIR